jgi:hypothetical protein
MKNIIVLILSIFLFASCGAKMERKEIHDLVFGYDRGLMVGVDIGDSWETVKNNHRDGWTVREEDGIYQFRKDWDQGNDMMFVTFQLDQDQNVEGMEFSMTATPGNWEEMKILEKKFVSDLNLITSSENKNEWSYYGPYGDEYTVIYVPSVGDDERKYFSVHTIKH